MLSCSWRSIADLDASNLDLVVGVSTLNFIAATLNTGRLVMPILVGWFRTHPAEASARMTPGDAIEVCRRLRA